MEETLNRLSLIAFVKISNTFNFFHATEQTRKWIVEAEHCTHRGQMVKAEGSNLLEVLQEVEMSMEEISGMGIGQAKDKAIKDIFYCDS